MINWYNKPMDAYPNHKDYEELTFIECGEFNNMTELEKKLTNDLLTARDFVLCLIRKLPKSTLNDERLHIYRGNEDLGTMKEFINKNLEEIWGIKIKWY